MPKVTFIEYGGYAHNIDARENTSLMEAAVRHTVPGIDADCGGACACATCHVYVGDAWIETVGPCSEMERSMLDFAEGVQANSRLACQIKLTPELDGLVVHLPEHQH